MIDSKMISELLAYSGWADESLVAPISGLTPEQLDRPFDIGPGSLRAALRHIYFAERLWAQRLGVPGWHGLPPAESLHAITEITGNQRALVDGYRTWLHALPSDELQRTVVYTDLAGMPWKNTLGDALVHVFNHGVHHRAQAVNMLRALHQPLPKPGIDYIFMRLNSPAEPPAVTVAAVQRLFAYGDWATARISAAAQSLTDDRLDQPFEIGPGTLRATICHIRDAEKWWLDNWTGRQSSFPNQQSRPAIQEIHDAFVANAAGRNDFLQRLGGPEDLRRTVMSRPRPNMTFESHLGVTMIQLWMHGTHHRAQALNMLRRLGGPTPAMDYIAFAREPPDR